MVWFRTSSNVLIWLLAALVPLQGIPNASCCCAAQAKVTADADETPARRVGRCSCRQQCVLVAEPSAATHSCCQRPDSDVERTGCDCGTDCQCKKGESSPRPKQIPLEHRTQTDDLATGSLVVFYFECGDLESMATAGRTGTSLAGVDRCVFLCRFQL